MKIVSSGRTGVEAIGFQVARSLGISTGGFTFRGHLDDIIEGLPLRTWGIIEVPEGLYHNHNVEGSDGTVFFGHHGAHTLNTEWYCQVFHKPYLRNPTVEELLAWLQQHTIKTLNVTGDHAEEIKILQPQMYTHVLTETFRLNWNL